MREAEPIQNVKPARVERAGTLEEYCDIVRRCADAGEKIADYGVAHHGLGHAPPHGHVRITAPTDTFVHWTSDLSVRAPGGMTIGELQRRLAEFHQFLPIDADDDMTVAEVIAHNVYGPLRLTHGTCRDLLLGLRYIDATGTLVTVGGRTVKNVAGYDVTRMMVGSLNTLGLIVDANLRTAAVPPQVTRIEITGFDTAALDPLMTDLLTSDAAPYYIETHGPHLALGYSGSYTGCEAQFAAWQTWIAARVPAAHKTYRIDTDPAADTEVRAATRGWRRAMAGHVQMIVPPAHTGRAANALNRVDPQIERVDTLPAHGILHAGGNWSPDEALGIDQQVARILAPLGGLRIWRRRPEDMPGLAPFAPPQSDWPMLTRIKQTMDPAGMFNPGRFP